jgi:NADH:ubiquinone oxidoreductase subunit 2 (subunit N)
MIELGLASVAFYMFAYLFTNMGAFAIVTLFEDKTGSCEIADYDGLARTSPSRPPRCLCFCFRSPEFHPGGV